MNIAREYENITNISNIAHKHKKQLVAETVQMYNVQMYGGPTVLPDSLVASGRSRVGRFLAGQQGGCRVKCRAGEPEQAGREPSAMGVRYKLLQNLCLQSTS